MVTVNIRNVPPEVAERARLAARSRGITMGQYLAALVRLHDGVRGKADAGDDGLQAELTALGLETVTR